jgi:hypothetical protein
MEKRVRHAHVAGAAKLLQPLTDLINVPNAEVTQHVRPRLVVRPNSDVEITNVINMLRQWDPVNGIRQEFIEPAFVLRRCLECCCLYANDVCKTSRS